MIGSLFGPPRPLAAAGAAAQICRLAVTFGAEFSCRAEFGRGPKFGVAPFGAKSGGRKTPSGGVFFGQVPFFMKYGVCHQVVSDFFN